MSKMTWSKWQWDVHSREWDIHPAWMEGAWMRILRRLHFSDVTGTMTMDLASWARATGCSEDDTNILIEHLKKHNIADVEEEDGITIVCRRMRKEVDKTEYNRQRQAKHRKSIVEIECDKKKPVKRRKSSAETNKRIVELLDKLRDGYHQEKAHMQPAGQQAELKKILAEATSGKRTAEDKELSENAIIERIISCMSDMKETKSWKDDDGKYVPGLGNFLKSRVWTSNIKIKKSGYDCWRGVDPEFAKLWKKKAVE